MSSEQDVDRALKAALSVSPSADFEARVRQRIEADRPPRAGHHGWLAAAASLVIAAGVLYALNRTPVGVIGPPAPQIVERAAPPVEAPRPDAPLHRDTIEPQPTRTVRVARHAPRTEEPEVLVRGDQMEAVRRLVRAINEGRLEVPAEPPQGPLAPPAAIGVAPVVVASISLSPLGPGTETAAPNIRDIK
jgi:hypothetical protein